MIVLLVMALLAAPLATADDGFRLQVGGLLDVRAARTATTASWLDGGLGKVRYGGEGGESRFVLGLAQASAVVKARFGETLGVHVQVNVDTGSYPRSGLAGVDLVEAFATWRPDLSDTFGLRLRGGHFFPPVSLENDGVAWSPTRTITPSAVNSWIGEEVRVTGLEASLLVRFPTSDLTLTGAVFGWNDPCGSLLAWRGWGVGDRQTGATDRLPLAPLPAIGPDGPFPQQEPWVAPFREVDGRAGWYAGVSYSRPELLEVRALLSDNRGDPLRLERGQYSWATRYSAYGLKLRLPLGAELLAQLVDGWTEMGPGPAVDAYYRSWYLLASVPFGRHRLSLRYDDLEMWEEDPFEVLDPNRESGSAWTAAYSFELDRRTAFLLELLSVDSSRPARLLVGLPERARETVVQLSVRGRF